MTVVLPVDRERVGDFCRKWQIAELSLFGSVLRDDFGPESDVDVLVTFAPGSHRTMSDLAQMEEELQTLFGRAVDLVERSSVERSHNYIRRREVLRHIEKLYGP